MTTAADLLPPNATPAERAIAASLHATLPVPLRQIMDPNATPTAWLPWLAAHDSVDLWFEDWAVARKRQMVNLAPTLARLTGTVAGPQAFLNFVDGTILDRIAYPTRFVMNRAVIGRTPIGHPTFTARYLVRVVTVKPPRAFVIGRSAMGNQRIKTPSREPFRRCRIALTASKSPDTEYRVDFAHQRVITLDSGIPMNGSIRIGQYVPRAKL